MSDPSVLRLFYDAILDRIEWQERAVETLERKALAAIAVGGVFVALFAALYWGRLMVVLWLIFGLYALIVLRALVALRPTDFLRAPEASALLTYRGETLDTVLTRLVEAHAECFTANRAIVERKGQHVTAINNALTAMAALLLFAALMEWWPR